MVLQMLRNIAEKIRPTVIYTILADETSVVLDREQLVFCIKWVDGSLQAHEDFKIWTNFCSYLKISS